MSLTEKLARIEKNQKLLQEEILQAKQEAALLEEENQRLQRQLIQFGEIDVARLTENGQKIRQTPQGNLEKLYLEGFHICHLFFAQDRAGECLFCLGILGK